MCHTGVHARSRTQPCGGHSPASRGVLQSHPHHPQPPTFLRVRLLYRRSWHGSDPAGGDHAGCARCPLPAGGEHSWVSARGSDTMGLWRCGLIQRLCPQPPLYLITSERQRIPQPLPIGPETARHIRLPLLAPSTVHPHSRRRTGRPRGWTDARPPPGRMPLWRLWGMRTTSRPRNRVRLETAAGPWPQMVSSMACSPGSSPPVGGRLPTPGT